VIADLVADELASAVAGHRPVAPGTAVVTGAGSLTASNNVRRIIHVASVQGEPGAGFRQVRNIDQCVTNALVRAEQEAERDARVRTVLFPLFGTGTAVGADLESTARQMIAAAFHHLSGNPATRLHEIAFLGYTVTEFAVLRRVLSEFPVAMQEPVVKGAH
jgi:O-acetyl-ADP-ribose deacetylase (regulator of RNase III)